MEEGENPEESAIREVKEELGIEVKNPEYHGIIEFINDGKLAFLCYVFTANKFSGKPEATEEADPLWCDTFFGNVGRRCRMAAACFKRKNCFGSILV